MIKALLSAITAIFLCISSVYSQQDPLYSQYMFNLMAINSGYTGIHNNLNISLTSRWQWAGLDGSPRTNTLAAHTSVFGDKLGLGALILRDELGVNENTEGHITYSYKIKSTDYTLSFGLRTGIINYKYNYNDLTLRFLDDPNFVPVSEGATTVNFGTGVVFLTDRFLAGISIPRIINNEFKDGAVKSTRYERHFYATGAYLIELQRGIKIKPMVLVKGVQGAPVSFDLNASILLNNRLWAGIFTRDFNSYGIMAQFEFMDAFRIGYSFETPTGAFVANDLFTHEVMLSIDLKLLPEHDIYQRYF